MSKESKRTALIILSILLILFALSKFTTKSNTSKGKSFTILGTWYNHKGEVFQKKMEILEDGTYTEHEDQASISSDHEGWKEIGKGTWKEDVSESGSVFRIIEDGQEYGTAYSVNSWGNLEYKEYGQNILIIWTR